MHHAIAKVTANANAGPPQQPSEGHNGGWSWELYISPVHPPPEVDQPAGRGSGPTAIEIHGVDASWTGMPDDTISSTLALRGLSLALPQGKLSVVTGEVGAGL